jgi:hypothetical protein
VGGEIEGLYSGLDGQGGEGMAIGKPSEQEEEYFARQEFERLKKLAEAERAKLQEEDRDRLRQAHAMRCPKCGAELVPVRYRGVEVDKCTGCGGIWLDCGELEQLVPDEAGFLGGLMKIFR